MSNASPWGADSPTIAAAFARQREPSRLSFRATAMDVWRVRCLMSRSLAPATTADVASPARRLRPV